MSHQEHFFLECMPAVFTSPKSAVTGGAPRRKAFYAHLPSSLVICGFFLFQRTYTASALSSAPGLKFLPAQVIRRNLWVLLL